MGEGPNDWKWQVGLASHEGKAAENPQLTGLAPNGRGEARAVGSPRAEALMAKPAPKSPAATERLMVEWREAE